MNWLKSPYTVEEAESRAKRLRENANGILLGANEYCKHPKEKLVIDCLTNQNADNKRGPESLVSIYCNLCESKKTIESKTPICSKCSKPTPRGIVFRITAGKIPQKHSRDYNEKYPCVCPKCGDVEEVTLFSSYS